jgi:hypothetical protein
MCKKVDKTQQINGGVVTTRLRLGLLGGLLFGEGSCGRMMLEPTAAVRSKMVDGVGDSEREWQTLCTEANVGATTTLGE